jgi:hypothetical protein
MMTTPSLADITGRYVGRPFREVSCMGLVSAIYETELGLTLPHAFEDLSLDTYLEKWRTQPAVVGAQLMRWCRTVGRAVPLGGLAVWDLMIVRWQTLSPAIYVGRRQVLRSTVQGGVEVCPLGRWARPVAARRLIDA